MVQTIFTQCPFPDGKPVYEARAMVDISIIGFYTFARY
jgi:hypothetical protein